MFRYASLPCKICLWQTGILNGSGVDSVPRQTKTKPKRKWSRKDSLDTSCLRGNRNDLAALCLPNLLVFEPNRQTGVCQRAFWTISTTAGIKNTANTAVFFIPGGVEGIRTLDTVAGILHFQCSALDQLCDDSGINYSSSESGVLSDSSSSATAPSSIRLFSNSASISRNSGSTDSTSSVCSAVSAIGASL